MEKENIVIPTEFVRKYIEEHNNCTFIDLYDAWLEQKDNNDIQAQVMEVLKDWLK